MLKLVIWKSLLWGDNLCIVTSKLTDGFGGTHTLPKSQEFEDFFKRSGIYVHDPKYLIWRERNGHIGTPSKQHLTEWRNFIENHPKATVADILKERDRIENKTWGNTTGDTSSY